MLCIVLQMLIIIIGVALAGTAVVEATSKGKTSTIIRSGVTIMVSRKVVDTTTDIRIRADTSRIAVVIKAGNMEAEVGTQPSGLSLGKIRTALLKNLLARAKRKVLLKLI